MKKTKLLLVSLLSVVAFAGCNGGNGTSTPVEDSHDTTSDVTTDSTSEEAKVYNAVLDSTAKYLVTVGEGEEAVTTITSKKDLREKYAMAAKNGGYNPAVTLEWFEQAAEIEKAVVGKKSTEISASDATFGAATIGTADLAAAIAEANSYANKEHVGPQAEGAPVKQTFGEGAAEGSVYSGLGYVATLGKANENHVSKAEVTVAYASFDEEGKVVDARFDVIQLNVSVASVDEKGSATYTVDGEKSKLEKGSEYKMYNSPYGGSKLAEADEQIEALADWAKGHTVAEFATEQEKTLGETNGAEWVTSTTIGTDAFATALKNAYGNKTATAASITAGSRAGVGIVVSTLKAGKTELTINIAGSMTSADEKVETALVDAVVIPLTTSEVK